MSHGVGNAMEQWIGPVPCHSLSEPALSPIPCTHRKQGTVLTELLVRAEAGG